MKISIIIPVYNVSSYIEACLKSVFNQTYTDIEVVLVDDCGTDNSMEVAERVVSEFGWQERVKIIHHSHNRGLSAARNSGIQVSTGQYLFFLDSDDELPKEAMQSFMHYIERYGEADFLIGNYIVEGDFNFIAPTTPVALEGTANILQAYTANSWYMMACGKLISREFFLKNNLWFAEHRLHEDDLFSFQLALKATKMITVSEQVYKYIIRENSITTRKKKKNYIDTFWIIEQKISLMKQNKSLFYFISSGNYVINALWILLLSVAVSDLSIVQKSILLKWMKCVQLHRYKISIKSKIQYFILHLPSRIPLYMVYHYAKKMRIK